MPIPLAGVLPIVQTPWMGQDQIDLPSLRRLVDWVYACGASGCGTGMVSEVLRLTPDEWLRLTENLVEFNAGRGAVFASVSAESTQAARDLARRAAALGCDAIMAAPPCTAPVTPDALETYFCTLAEEVDLPLVVQDASGYVGQPIPLQVCVSLWQRYGEEKILFKPEAQPLGPNLSRLREATSDACRIFEGSGGILLVDAYRRGVAGTMPALDLLDAIVRLWEALEKDDDSEIYRVYLPVCALIALQMQAGLDGFLAIEKYILHRRGLIEHPSVRGPVGWTLDEPTRAEVDRLLLQLEAALQQDADTNQPETTASKTEYVA